METNLKKLLPLLGVVCFSMTSLSAGNYDDQHHSSDRHMRNNAVAPPVHGGEEGACCFISADYTYWTARQAGLAVGTSGYFPTALTNPTAGKMLYPKWFGKSGFKVGLGAFLNHDGWEINGEYTWFYNKGNSMSTLFDSTSTSRETLGTWRVNPPSGTVLRPEKVAAKWDNYLNRIDVEVGRAFYAGHYLALRPYMGLLGAWEDQWFDFNYYTLTGDANPHRFSNKQDWWGVGPMSGIDATFFFPTGMDSSQFSMFLNMGSALPWGHYKVSMQNQNNTAAKASAPFQYYYKDDYYTTDPMFEMALGLRWESWWNDSHSMFFCLSAAWEEQVWFSHNHFYPMDRNAAVGHGNMILQGLTVKAMFGF